MSARFRSEIKLARRVSHWNVCRIYEYGEDAGLQYISMELVEGPNLKQWLAREGPPEAARAYALAQQVADGLQAVHQAGIVHRDLKTPNIMVDARGVVRVMDFGIARAAAPEGGRESSTGYVLGSPEYMSPEQARGQPADFRSDVYSLGIVVFEIFAGHVPFHADTPVATLLMHLESPPPLQGPGAPALPPRLVPVLARALAKDPAARYTSAREAADALRAAAAEGDTEKVATRAQPAVGAPPARRVAAASAAATLALAIAAVLVAWWRSQLVDAVGPSAAVPLATPAPAPTAPTSPSYTFVPDTPAPTPTVAAASPSPAPPERRAVSLPSPTPEPAVTPSPMPTPAAEAPTPTPPPAPPTTAPSPSPAPATAPAAQTGSLLVLARPWASVVVDGVVIGDTPMKAIPLSAGPHSVVLTHPDYQPYPRRVVIVAGETFRLALDFANEGVRRR
jgi:serine/threonine-protein kinase